MNELVQRYNDALQRTIDAARLVTIFDGTDRESLDALRESLFALGALQVELEEKLGYF
jgi:hypothetical protein